MPGRCWFDKKRKPEHEVDLTSVIVYNMHLPQLASFAT